MPMHTLECSRMRLLGQHDLGGHGNCGEGTAAHATELDRPRSQCPAGVSQIRAAAERESTEILDRVDDATARERPRR
jgi:hypothetical protein